MQEHTPIDAIGCQRLIRYIEGLTEEIVELSPVEFNGLGQGGQAFGTQVGFWVTVLLPGPQEGVEARHVEPDFSRAVQADALPVHDQPLSPQGLFEYREIAAQA